VGARRYGAGVGGPRTPTPGETASPDGARLQRRRHRRRWRRRTLVGLGALVGLAVLATGLLLAAVPSVATAPRLARQIAARHHGRLLGTVPPKVRAAVTAIEDQAFGDPPGVDIVVGVVRYVYAHLQGHHFQGGATIAQQLAKQLYTGPNVGVLGELEQVGLALELELTYSPTRILELYLDVDYFGDGATGLVNAAADYFGTTPARLNWAQAALLAGLLQAPSADDPRTHPRRAIARRAAVVAQLEASGSISARQAAAIDASPLGIVPRG
jgi:membrane peptidoglycan carboxypeptidase